MGLMLLRATKPAQRQAWILVTLTFLITLPLMNGCGGGMKTAVAPGATTSFAFVANSASGNLSVFAVGDNGVLSPVGRPVAAGAGAEFMAVDPIHNFLYVSNQNANTLSAFAVNTSTGSLTAVAGSPIATGATPHGVAVDPAGRFVFVGNQGDNSVSAFAINATNGALTPVPGSPFIGIDSPFGVTVNPSGAFLYVNNFGSNTVSAFRIDSISGTLAAAASPSPTGQTPMGLIADPNGKFVYVGNHMGNSVTAYSVAPGSGSLTPVGGAPSNAGACSVSCHSEPLRLAIDPAGQFAYVSNVGNNTVSAYSLNNGTLTPVSASLPTGQHPFGVALDPTGSFLYVVNKVDNTISAFSVNAPQAMFTSVPGAPFPAGGSGPVGIVIVAKR